MDAMTHRHKPGTAPRATGRTDPAAKRGHIAKSETRPPHRLPVLNRALAQTLCQHAKDVICAEISDETYSEESWNPDAFNALLVLMTIGLGRPIRSVLRTRIVCIGIKEDGDIDFPDGAASFALEQAAWGEEGAPILLVELPRSPLTGLTGRPIVHGFLLDSEKPYCAVEDDAEANLADLSDRNIIVPALGLGYLLLQWYVHRAMVGMESDESDVFDLIKRKPWLFAFSGEMNVLHPSSVHRAEEWVMDYLGKLAVDANTFTISWSSSAHPPSAPPGWGHWNLTALASYLGLVFRQRPKEMTSRINATATQGLFDDQERVRMMWILAMHWFGLDEVVLQDNDWPET